MASGRFSRRFFTTEPVTDYVSATASDTDSYATFFRALLAEGVYPPPSQFEGWFLSAAHTEKDIDRTIRAAGKAMQAVQMNR